MSANEYDILSEKYRRLRAVAARIVEEAEAVGDREHPMCGVSPYLIRTLRRELEHVPQATAFATMSAS